MATLNRLVAIVVALLLSGGVAIAQTEQRVALVIGNGNYLSVGKLKNAANDATAMAVQLRRAGFEVIERENVSRRAMIQAARSFAEKLSPGGIGLLYYAGHGIQAQGSNYLVPVDANLAVEDDLRYETIDLQDILNKLNDARVRLSIVILDACRDNPFKSFRSGANGLAMINPPAGTVIAYATAPGKVAGDGDGDHSVFTSALLQAMSKPDKLLDVFEHVTDAVARQTGNMQTPWINSSFRGDFYFIRPTAETVVPPPPEPAQAATQAEIVFWQSIAGSSNPADFDAHLQQFPQGSFATLARLRLASLSPHQVTARPPSAADAKPPEVKTPRAASAAPPKQNPAVANSAVRPKAASDQVSAPVVANPQPPRIPAGASPLALATAAPPSPRGAEPSLTDPAAPAGGAPAADQGSTVQPTQEAMVRPPPVGILQPPPPAAVPPQSAVPAHARPARSCRFPHFTGMETGAGAYAAIQIVNTGERCGVHLRSGWQKPFDSLSLSKPPTHGSVSIEGSAFYYTPTAGYVGTDEFAIVSQPWGHVRAVVNVLPPTAP